MSKIVNVIRLHFIDRLGWIVVPVLILTASLLVNLVIWILIGNEEGNYTGGLSFVPVYAMVLGTLAISRTLHFGFALSLTRKGFYLGTVSTGLILSAAAAGGCAVLARIEAWTGGWGVNGHFFRVPWLLDGPWYQDFLVIFSLVASMFMGGLLISLFLLRFGVTTFLVVSVAIVLLLGVVSAIISWQRWWGSIGRTLSQLTPTTTSAVVLMVGLAAGLLGYSTIRRLTV